MTKNKTALEVNTDSDTSKSMEQKTDQIADSKLSDENQVNDSSEDRDTQNSADDSIKGLDKTADDNKTSDNGNGYTAEVNDSSKDITDASDSSYMADTEEDNKNTVKDSVKDNNSNSVIDDTDNGKTVKPERELTNIEKYRLRVGKDVVRENSARGGRNAAESKRARKTLGETLTAILETGTNQEDLCLALFQSALKGNYKAFNSLRDTIGEMPTQKQEVTTNMTEGDRELLENVQKRLKEQNVTK